MSSNSGSGQNCFHTCESCVGNVFAWNCMVMTDMDYQLGCCCIHG